MFEISMIDLESALMAVVTRAEMEAFLAALLSAAELKKLQTRLELFRRALTGQSHRAVSQELHVGVATVTRAAAAVHDHAEIIQKIFSRIAGRASSHEQ
jgi:Trp operon repressor